MHASSARKAIVAAFAAGDEIARATRKDLNPALFALGLPTLGKSHTVQAYVKSLNAAQGKVLADALAKKSASAKKESKIERQACGHKFCPAGACKWTKAA